MNTTNKRFLKLCEHLNFAIPEEMNTAEIVDLQSHNNSDHLEITILFNDEVSVENFYALYNAIKNNRLYKITAHFIFDLLQYKHTNIVKFIEYTIFKKVQFSKLRSLDWNKELISLNDYDYEVVFIDQFLYEQNSVLIQQLLQHLHKYGFNKLNITSRLKKIDIGQMFFDNSVHDKVAQQKFNELLKNREKINLPSPSTKEYSRKKWSQKQYEITDVHQIHSLPEGSDISIKGEIYDFSYLETKNKKHIYTVFITDYNDAISAKIFKNEPLEADIIKNDLAIGNWINVKGSTSISKIGKPELFVIVDYFEKSEKLLKTSVDNAPSDKKRVELNVSSKFSTMDGLISPEDIIARAKQFGMSAVAISDIDAVQGYPKFYQAAKKAQIKALYGASYSTFSKNPTIFLGSIPQLNISDVEYVSFDIETTGLSPHFHELIEYGSYSISPNKKESNKTQFLIKPKEKISPFTTNLTGITQSDIDDKGLDIKVALQKIYDDLDGKIAIAHNAKFDYHFLKEQFRLHQMPFPNVCVIDTLVVSRIIFSDRKKHSLGELAANLGVDYNPNIAHRGDYDAEVLAKVWLEMMNAMTHNQIKTFEDLDKYESETKHRDRHPYVISVLVRNQNGLKKQFNMISSCLTTNYNFGPKTYFEDIKPDKDLLFGSGTLKSKLLDDYFYSSREQFENEIQRYDYIEIPAPQVFQHWIDREFITKTQLEYALKDIILTAKKYNKIPVATGDVRYLDTHDKKAYEILVYAKGIGGVRHSLYRYDLARDARLTIPTQNFLTTEEMLEQFSFLQDKQLIEEIVILNTNLIANMCEEVQVIKDKLYTPNFDDSAHKLRELVYKNAHIRYGENLPKIIEKRVEAELTPIIKYGFDVIYWISHKLVKKSLDEGFIVGSRGSVGSSLVASLCDISEVNPLDPHYICKQCKYFEISNIEGISSAYDLPNKQCPNCKIDLDRDGHKIAFETFLGFNADKVPDIDLNFSGEFQGEVHNETRRLFGHSHTLRAGTISTIAFKTGFGYVKSYCEETHNSYSDAFASFLAKKIEGVKRTTGQHPGGIIIIPKEYDVSDFTPINYPADDVQSTWFTTHFEYKAIHDNVLKLDLLGHDNPTIIKLLEKYTGVKVAQLPKNDPEVVKIFSSTEPMKIKPEDIGGEYTGALGLPEFGTQFVRQMLLQAKPKSFADLVSISGLSHGTNVWIGNAQDLIMKQGYKLQDIFCCRDDILVQLVKQGVENKYAFNIMEKVRKGKGLTPEEEQHLKKTNVEDWQIDSMKKIAYMFPKAHAVAYVLMAWWIGWFKIHHPLAFYAAYYATHAKEVDIDSMVDIKNGRKCHIKLQQLQSLSKDELKDKDKGLIPTLEITRELYARGFYIANIDLKLSQAHEWLIDHQRGCLIPPFKALEGLGDSVASSIIAARSVKEFTSIQDFAMRAKVNKTLVEKLEKSGVFAKLDPTDQMTLF